MADSTDGRETGILFRGTEERPIEFSDDSLINLDTIGTKLNPSAEELHQQKLKLNQSIDLLKKERDKIVLRMWAKALDCSEELTQSILDNHETEILYNEQGSPEFVVHGWPSSQKTEHKQ